MEVSNQSDEMARTRRIEDDDHLQRLESVIEQMAPEPKVVAVGRPEDGVLRVEKSATHG